MFPTAITVGPSSSSYLPLTPFEALFILLAIIQVSVLQTTGIVPLNLNNLFTGDPSGRKRKRKRRHTHIIPLDVENLKSVSSMELMRELLHTLYKLDTFDCVGKIFCLLLEMDLEDLVENTADFYPYRDLDGLSTTTESSAHQKSGRLSLFKATLEALRGPNSSPISSASATDPGPDYDYDYETWHDEQESTTPTTATNTIPYSFKYTQNYSISHPPKSGSGPGQSPSLAGSRPRGSVSVCEHLHKSCPITGQDTKLYTQKLFSLARTSWSES